MRRVACIIAHVQQIYTVLKLVNQFHTQTVVTGEIKIKEDTIIIDRELPYETLVGLQDKESFESR